MYSVTVSSKGQIAIPKEIRDRLNIREGTRMVLQITNEGLVLQRDFNDWRSLQGLAAGDDLISAHVAEKREELALEKVRL